jgi:hypothetical protein
VVGREIVEIGVHDPVAVTGQAKEQPVR